MFYIVKKNINFTVSHSSKATNKNENEKRNKMLDSPSV